MVIRILKKTFFWSKFVYRLLRGLIVYLKKKKTQDKFDVRVNLSEKPKRKKNGNEKKRVGPYQKKNEKRGTEAQSIRLL